METIHTFFSTLDSFTESVFRLPNGENLACSGKFEFGNVFNNLESLNVRYAQYLGVNQFGKFKMDAKISVQLSCSTGNIYHSSSFAIGRFTPDFILSFIY